MQSSTHDKTDPPDVENATAPLMPPIEMNGSTKTHQYDSQKIDDAWCWPLFCCVTGVLFCLPCCPLYNVWKYRKLKHEQKLAKSNGERYEIDKNYIAIANFSLYFAIFLIVWFVASLIVCLIDDNCIVLNSA